MKKPSKLSKLFEKACSYIDLNSSDKLKALCQQHPSILDKRDKNGNTLLHLAILADHPNDLVSAILPDAPVIFRLYRNNEKQSVFNLAEEFEYYDIMEKMFPYFYYRLEHQATSFEKYTSFVKVLNELLESIGTELPTIHRTLGDKSEEELSYIQRKLSEAISQVHYHPDLWDDIFDNDETYRPVYDEDDEDTVHYYYDSIRENFKTGKDCRAFILDRVKLCRFYIFIKCCVDIYQSDEIEGNLREQCRWLINIILDEKNDAWLKRKLRVKAFEFVGENWKSGLHEWVACSITKETIQRSAGLVKGVQSHLPECSWAWIDSDGNEQTYICSKFSWIDSQLLLRTPTKYVIFQHLESGHVRSMSKHERPPPGRGNPGFLTKGNKGKNGFEAKIQKAFEESATIPEYVKSMRQIYSTMIFHARSEINPTSSKNYLVDGTTTDDKDRLELFQNSRLDRQHRTVRRWVGDMILHMCFASSASVKKPVLYTVSLEEDISVKKLAFVANIGSKTKPEEGNSSHQLNN